MCDILDILSSQLDVIICTGNQVIVGASKFYIALLIFFSLIG